MLGFFLLLKKGVERICLKEGQKYELTLEKEGSTKHQEQSIARCKERQAAVPSSPALTLQQ